MADGQFAPAEPCAQEASVCKSILICAGCGAELHRKRRAGRAPKWCASCRASRPDQPRRGTDVRQCVICQQPFTAHRDRARFCSPRCREKWQRAYRPERPPKTFSCVECGQEFSRQHSAKFCGPSCLSAYRRRLAREQNALPRVPLKYPRIPCRRCGVEFQPRNAGGKNARHGQKHGIYCSRACAGTVRKETVVERPPRLCRQCGKPNPPRRRVFCCDECQKALGRRPSTRGNCEQCGAEFAGIAGRRFCSVKCGHANFKKRRPDLKKRRKHRARARHFGVHYESFDPRLVFERDKWICQICGKKTRKPKDGQLDHLMASLDHIVPLSKGGAHTMANTQCAHFICNSLKGNRVAPGDQLRLFG